VIDHLSEVQQRSFRVSIVILTYDISRREKILLDHYVKNYWHTLCLPYMAEPCHETFRNLHWNAASRTRDFEPWPTADGRRRTILPNATESRWQEEGKISHDPTLHMIPWYQIQKFKFPSFKKIQKQMCVLTWYVSTISIIFITKFKTNTEKQKWQINI
jgi:hypothetical protein